MQVLYTKASGQENETLKAELGARRVGLDELLAESDFISIHTPLTPTTRHLFRAETFARMKPCAIIINTARGPVIKEEDLVAALRARTIGGAGLDVYECEPHMAEGLADLDNAVVVPHIGSATSNSRAGMSLLAARNLLAMLQGEKPESCLNPEIYA
jgi:glyoxylate reductase